MVANNQGEGIMKDEIKRNRLTIPSHVHLLCGDVVGFDEARVSIVDCVGSDFHYRELMGERAPHVVSHD